MMHRFYKMAKGAAKILLGKKSPSKVSGDTRVAQEPACEAEPELAPPSAVVEPAAAKKVS
jgi:hypothetical protein